MREDTKEYITIVLAMFVAAVISFWVVVSLKDATNKEEPVRIQKITVVDVATGDTLVVHLHKHPYAVKKLN